MLQKKSKPWLHKLRIVQLFEADFNSVLKFLLGRRLMAHSELHGLNTPQLYGSRKNKSALEALIMLRVLYDMARMDRVFMVSLFNDLKGCYDRIRPSLNTITLRRMGCPRGVAICQAETLRKMKHAIKTTYGITCETISADGDNKLGGIGQGSGEGPVSWHSQMLALIDSYEELIPHRAFFTSPDKTLKITQWLVGFVDDNTIVFTIKDPLFARDNIQNLFNMANECLEV